MASVVNSSTSICGIDVGSENCYVAVARQGGIEILLNEYSQRSTPAYIGFGGSQRELGVSAKQKQMMNLRNTCFAPTLIIGKKFKELDLNEIPYTIEKDKNDDVVVVVEHNQEQLRLSPTQVLAMLFTKLRQISGNVIDCVINCPNYFNDTQKRALIDAASIAGLNPLKVIPDMTAIALYYGFYRNSTSQDISIVGFVDCGQTSIQASIVLFNHKENSMRVLDAGYEPSVGGKNFDDVLADHFVKQKKLQLNKRARYRLLAECEKVKKQMSANSNELPINIECLQDDADFSARIDRNTFESLSEDLLQKIKVMLQHTYDGASEKYRKDFAEKFGDFKIDSVEIVGGTSRIPAIKRFVRETFTVDPSTTLNADEAVARGCALQCAILSPTFKVARELQIIDSLANQINFRYSTDGSNFKTVTALYPKGHQFPFTKQISLSCQTLPIIAAFDYTTNEGASVNFAQFEIRQPDNVDLSEIVKTSPIKLRVRVDSNGLFSIVNATVAYEKNNVDSVDHITNNAENMETDESAVPNNNEQNNDHKETQNAEEPKRKSKAKSISTELIVDCNFIIGKQTLEAHQKWSEFEANLILADKNWKEKTDAKNALEEFIYEWRDRIESGSYDAFVKENDKANFQKKLEENESWLYQQDEEEKMHSKSVYEERTSTMAKGFADRILNLKREFENRPRYLEQLGKMLQQAEKLVQVLTADQEDKDDSDKFAKEMEEKHAWYDEAQGKLANSKTFDDPPVKCEEIQHQTAQVDAAIKKLQNSRNRRAEQKRKAAEAAAAAAAEAKKKAEQPKNEAGDSPMDVDASQNDTAPPTEN